MRAILRSLVLLGLIASSAAAQTPPRIGPTFAAELVTAGCVNGVSWTAEGTLTLAPGTDPACPNQVLAAHDPTKPAVPFAVTRLQGRMQLSHAGLLSQAEAAISSAGGDLLIWYADAQTWRRDDPHVLAIGTALNLSPAQIDALFVAAATIQ
ncbi:MAG: hypothetical protein ACRYGP_13900 [Janthinobacterium lividum]